MQTVRTADGDSAMRIYALVEPTIGLSAIVVPYELLVGRKLLDRLAVSSSPAYYLVSDLWVAATLIPWCVSLAGQPGPHFLASEHPILDRTPQELADRLPPPPPCRIYWNGPGTNAAEQFSIMLGREFRLDQMISRAADAAPLQDDRPENEYFLLRQYMRSKV